MQLRCIAFLPLAALVTGLVFLLASSIVSGLEATLAPPEQVASFEIVRYETECEILERRIEEVAIATSSDDIHVADATWTLASATRVFADRGAARAAGGTGEMTQHCANPDCPGLERDGVAPEFVDRMTVCIDCGGRLMRGVAPDDVHERPGFTDYVTIFIAADPVQAHLVRGLIEAEDITCYLKGEALTSALGELPATVKQVEVQVPREDRERGLAVAARFERPSGRM